MVELWRNRPTARSFSWLFVKKQLKYSQTLTLRPVNRSVRVTSLSPSTDLRPAGYPTRRFSAWSAVRPAHRSRWACHPPGPSGNPGKLYVVNLIRGRARPVSQVSRSARSAGLGRAARRTLSRRPGERAGASGLTACRLHGTYPFFPVRRTGTGKKVVLPD